MRGGVFPRDMPEARGARADRAPSRRWRAATSRARSRPREPVDPRRRRRARAWSRSTPASRARSCATCASAACGSSCYPCTTTRRGAARARPRRRLPRQRPRRPGRARLRRRHRARAGRQGAGVRASASATSCSAARSASRPTSCRSATAARTTRSRTSRPGRIEITSQNHGFAVLGPGGEQHDRHRRAGALGDRLRRRRAVSTLNLYDRTVEGLVLRDVPGVDASSTTPRPGPGPHDALYLFDRFLELAVVCRAARRHPEDPRSSAPARS